jgi:hypothetical protein
LAQAGIARQGRTVSATSGRDSSGTTNELASRVSVVTLTPITDENKKQPSAENLTRIGREMAESLKLVRRADGKIAL